MASIIEQTAQWDTVRVSVTAIIMQTQQVTPNTWNCTTLTKMTTISSAWLTAHLSTYTCDIRQFTCKLHQTCFYLVSGHQTTGCSSRHLIAAYYSFIDPQMMKDSWRIPLSNPTTNRWPVPNGTHLGDRPAAGKRPAARRRCFYGFLKIDGQGIFTLFAAEHRFLKIDGRFDLDE